MFGTFSGDITLAGDGRTYKSNQIRSVLEVSAGSWLGWGSAFHPTDASGEEVTFQTTSTDGLTWTTPTGPVLPLVGGQWDDNSAENPWIVFAQ